MSLKCLMNINVLRADLNESIVFEFLISSGREFHRLDVEQRTKTIFVHRCGS